MICIWTKSAPERTQTSSEQSVSSYVLNINILPDFLRFNAVKSRRNLLYSIFFTIKFHFLTTPENHFGLSLDKYFKNIT